MSTLQKNAIRPGLVSITFRQLAPEEIVPLAVTAGLEGIEWGGDVHVPHGDETRAREVGRLTREHGLAIPAYGSYYRLAASEAGGLSFQAVLASAKLLGAPMIRVWAGVKGSAETGPAEREAAVEDLRRIEALAARESLTLSLEYHKGTLTDTPESTLALLEACASPNVTTYWQPRLGIPAEQNARELRTLLPRVNHLHVYQWRMQGEEIHRLPLEEGEADWRSFLEEARALPGERGERYAMLEFVCQNTPAQCLKDAGVLKRWLMGSR